MFPLFRNRSRFGFDDSPPADSPRRFPGQPQPGPVSGSGLEQRLNAQIQHLIERNHPEPRHEPVAGALAAISSPFHFRIQPDADIILLLESRLQDQIAEQHRSSDGHRGGDGFAYRAVVQEIASKEHGSLPALGLAPQ